MNNEKPNQPTHKTSASYSTYEVTVQHLPPNSCMVHDKGFSDGLDRVGELVAYYTKKMEKEWEKAIRDKVKKTLQEKGLLPLHYFERWNEADWQSFFEQFIKVKTFGDENLHVLYENPRASDSIEYLFTYRTKKVFKQEGNIFQMTIG